jgi:hypothetical protein
VACFELLYRYLPGGTDGKHENHRSGQPISVARPQAAERLWNTALLGRTHNGCWCKHYRAFVHAQEIFFEFAEPTPLTGVCMLTYRRLPVRFPRSACPPAEARPGRTSSSFKKTGVSKQWSIFRI